MEVHGSKKGRKVTNGVQVTVFHQKCKTQEKVSVVHTLRQHGDRCNIGSLKQQACDIDIEI